MKAQQGGRCHLLYTDTDSLPLDIETKNVYEEVAACCHLYDTSEFRKYRENKKVLRKMKDEGTGRPIAEYGGLGMDVLRSEGHHFYVQHLNRVSLSPFDLNRWNAQNSVDTLAYGDNAR